MIATVLDSVPLDGQHEYLYFKVWFCHKATFMLVSFIKQRPGEHQGLSQHVVLCGLNQDRTDPSVT